MNQQPPAAQVLVGDCRELMAGMGSESIDAIVTDPPAGIAFMNRGWDSDKGGRDQWVAWLTAVMVEGFRVLKPGGHALVWALPRTSHWTATAIEDAGFEIRDVVTHHFGSGFPKSHDVSKGIDKAAGVEREVAAEGKPVKRMIPGADQDATGSWIKDNGRVFVPSETRPATPEAEQWQGWGTALKPASEHWILARKPLIGTVVANVLQHGTGALNIDATRIETSDDLNGGAYSNEAHVARNSGSWRGERKSDSKAMRNAGLPGQYRQPSGRWPANVILGCSCEDEHEPDCAVRLLDEQSGVLTSGANPTRRGSPKFRTAYGEFQGQEECEPARGTDSGGASRFFYCAKASRTERTLPDGTRSNHPTVKPLALMRWLVRLVTPPGGVLLDPFAGSGSTLIAGLLEGFQVIGIEQDPAYAEIIHQRLAGLTLSLPLGLEGGTR